MAYLGIDIGSSYLSLVALDEDLSVRATAYRRHHGTPVKVLMAVLDDPAFGDEFRPVRTGAGSADLPLPFPYFDAVIAGLEGVRHLAPEARHALSMGGGSFYLVELNDEGGYRRSTLNSACASGTGAFLDQQALRLQVAPEALPELARRYTGTPPAVATRCAVFAKSDLIHLQQEGHSLQAIAAGLCRGLGYATVDGLLGGRRLDGATALIGGVALNDVVANAVEERLETGVVRIDRPELAGAWGAALLAQRQECEISAVSREALIEQLRPLLAGDSGGDTAGFMRPALALKKSEYPDFTWADHWEDDLGNEVAIPAARSGHHVVALGLDIGSTSTKAVLLDEKNDVAGWVYRRTAGDPVRAVQRVFKALRHLQERGGFEVSIRGVGVTGSGRKMIARVIGADLALNEITAHATAALFLDPSVDTIIELGGQDAKFTQLQNGMVYNSIMNYVCAAGTGSFIEEQAQKLGIGLAGFAELAMQRPAPPTSDRCTVYMERDLDRLLAGGWDKSQMAAAVLHSVRDNYLNKVVGGLHIGDHVCFQGATARNRALVAAFEVGLDKPIRVSRYCHLTGALGMALLVRQRMASDRLSAQFKGLEFADVAIRIEEETCDLCRNACRLSLIHGGGEPVAWGLKCGRDYETRKVARSHNPGYAFLTRRSRAWRESRPQEVRPKPAGAAGARVGLPQALGTYGYLPFWRAFLEAMDCRVVTGRASSEAILRAGREIATAEYCAPVVMSHGHARQLLDEEKVDFLFVPHMVEAAPPQGLSKAYFCGYVQAHASVLKSLSGLTRSDRILAPVVSFAAPPRLQVQRLAQALCEPLGLSPETIPQALRAGETAQAEFVERAQNIGRMALDQVAQDQSMGLVCIGRPYNTTDAGLTLDLPRKIAAMGYPVISLDMWPLDDGFETELARRNMYWHYGQRILSAAESLARTPGWFAIYFTHFMCGPDSYLLTYFKDIMARAGKPYLSLQMDGHGADAGYLTRVEAALETFHAWSGIPMPGRDGVGAQRPAGTADKREP